MKILVVGGGGREHALAWRLSQPHRVSQVYVAPGNAGTAGEPKISNVSIPPSDLDGLIDFAERSSIDLTVVGPEAPLVEGIADRFSSRGLRIFGPSQAAARLEGSKAFTKAFTTRHGIPTADYRTFEELAPALSYLDTVSLPVVVKADGLAAGKGVVIAHDLNEAKAAVSAMLAGDAFGEAGHRIVIEAFLEGEEASFIAVVGGGEALPLASSQDHKARDDGDVGPNTGGMGAYSPAPVMNPLVHQRVMERIIGPTIQGLSEEGIPYLGFLYAGVMVDPSGNPRLLEYNCRFGDPEAQPIMLRLQSDLAQICEAAIDGTLSRSRLEWDPRVALGVVMASRDYPQSYPKGEPIQGLASAQDVQVEGGAKVFHAGTSHHDGLVVTNGGRVLCVCALGETVRDAQVAAYERAEGIHWPSAFYRRDIGHRAAGS